MRQNIALRRQRLAPCPDSYWFRVEDYLTWAKAMREEARRATGFARAELIETAAQWEAIVCEQLDFLAELENIRAEIWGNGHAGAEARLQFSRPSWPHP